MLNLPANYELDYHYMGGKQIALTSMVPEPGSVVPLAVLLTPWIMRRRRRA